METRQHWTETEILMKYLGRIWRRKVPKFDDQGALYMYVQGSQEL
jgi:hypothetical protein